MTRVAIMNRHNTAAGPSAADPQAHKDETPAVGAARGFKDQGKASAWDCQGASHAGQALRVIEGERQAAQYLARLQAQQADPDELALIVAMLYGATLRGFCRVVARAIGGPHER